MIAMQRTDKKLRIIMEILSWEESERSIEDQLAVKGYLSQNRMLYKEVSVGKKQRTLWGVPDTMHTFIVVCFHDISGHIWALSFCTNE